MSETSTSQSSGPVRTAMEQRLHERYGASNQISSSIPWNDVLDTLTAHRSVRRYNEVPLPDGLVEILAAAAQSAPSSSNLQTFSLIAIEDRARKERLSKLAGNQKHIVDAPLLLAFVADLARLRTVCKVVGEPSEGLDYFETFLVSIADAAFASQNVLIAAESLGLGVCYIGALRNHPDAVAKELGLPAESFVVFGMTIGYPDANVATTVKPRLPQSIVLHREQYYPPGAEDIEKFDEISRSFRSGQQMSDIAWSEQVASRVRHADSLMGRDVLADVLRGRGFGLK